MSVTHKTYTGMIQATRNLISELKRVSIDHEQDYRSYSRRVDKLLKELNALWTNPADVEEAAKLRRDLIDAWNEKTA